MDIDKRASCGYDHVKTFKLVLVKGSFKKIHQLYFSRIPFLDRLNQRYFPELRVSSLCVYVCLLKYGVSGLKEMGHFFLVVKDSLPRG